MWMLHWCIEQQTVGGMHMPIERSIGVIEAKVATYLAIAGTRIDG